MRRRSSDGASRPGSPPVRHERSAHRGAFVIARDGKRLAEMTYTVAGQRLVEAAVLWAGAENVKLLPLCPFAGSVFDKTPDCADVLAR